MINQQIDTVEIEENEAPAPGQLDEDFIAQVVKNLSEGRKHRATWRKDAREDYEFFAGKQWADEDIEKLNEEGRPAVTFNRCARTINAVSGLEVQNRQEVRYFPRRNDPMPPDPSMPNIGGFGEMQTSAAKWVREQCDAEDEESEAFQDLSICGEGWTDTRMEYEDDPEGKIIIERIDPLEVVVDPVSKKRNHEDARWVAHIKSMTKKEITDQWGDVIGSDAGLFWQDIDSLPHDADNDWKYENDQTDNLNKSNYYSVVRYQYYDRIKMYKVLDPMTGKMIELDQDKFEKMMPVIEAQQARHISYPKRVFKQLFLLGRTLLEESELGCPHFTLRSMTGLRDRNRNHWYGLMRLMKDPQRWANKWLSQIQHIINTNAKGGLLAERGALQNPSKAEDDWSKPDAIIFLNDGALRDGRIQQREMPRYPEGIDRLLQYALTAINDVTGVSLELIGLAERDQPFVLEQTRKQAGITILATLFDSLRRYRKTQGRVLAYFIREYISDGRLIRVLGPRGAQYIPLIKSEEAFEYDIVVDDAPTSPNVKERTFTILNQIVPMCLQAGIDIPPDILDYAPLPEDLVQKWKMLIMKQKNDPANKQLQQIKMMLGMLELDQKQADIQKTSSETTKNYAAAEQAQAISQDESAQAMQKMGMTHAEHAMDYETMQKEQARKDLEMLLNMRRKQLESEQTMKIKSQEAAQKASKPKGGYN